VAGSGDLAPVFVAGGLGVVDWNGSGPRPKAIGRGGGPGRRLCAGWPHGRDGELLREITGPTSRITALVGAASSIPLDRRRTR